MAANATLRLIERYGVDPARVRYLALGTESSTDNSAGAIIVKGMGLAATLVGGFAGGFLARGYSLVTCLWIGGMLQAVSNLTFTWLALVGPQQWALSVAVTVEAFTGAIGTVILGIRLFGEPATALRLACVGLIVAGIVGLKLVT